ncbi:hypothetical protein KAT63_01360 [Candidatus Parcubacteria bacterium]|nr:hypothetical protein [Candidatus Parcubacteria bacterium]
MVTKEELGSMSGDELWERLVNDISGKDIANDIARALSKKWKVKSEKIRVLSKDGVLEEEEFEIRTPDKSMVEILADKVIIHSSDYELIVSTTKGWRRTGRIIKTIVEEEQ